MTLKCYLIVTLLSLHIFQLPCLRIANFNLKNLKNCVSQSERILSSSLVASIITFSAFNGVYVLPSVADARLNAPTAAGTRVNR